jgi:PIN domain nuclease of toxin-antitoxin system
MVATDAECRQQVDTVVDCNRAVGHSLGFEACLAEVEKLACTVVALPDLCDDVIKIQQ